MVVLQTLDYARTYQIREPQSVVSPVEQGWMGVQLFGHVKLSLLSVRVNKESVGVCRLVLGV